MKDRKESSNFILSNVPYFFVVVFPLSHFDSLPPPAASPSLVAKWCVQKVFV